MLAWELRDGGIDDRPKLSDEVLDKMTNADFMQSVFKMLDDEKFEEIFITSHEA